MTHQGHDVALVLVAASAAAALSAAAVSAADARVYVPPPWRRAAGVATVSLAVVALIVVFVRLGSPATLATRAWKGFSSSGASQNGSLNTRLFHLSGTWRTAQWHVAWLDVKRHPLLEQARIALRKAVAQSPNDWAPWVDLARATFGREQVLARARARALNPLGPAK